MGIVALVSMTSVTAGVLLQGAARGSATSSLGSASVDGAVRAGSTSLGPTSPHNGTLDVYDDYGGELPVSEDPAVDYEPLGLEPMENTLETLVSYDGSSSTGANPQAFVPVLATCVPGTVQCQTDYPSAPGTDLIVDNGAGQPQYYTFVIDPAAHFYDPSTGHSWKVYPTDVMFTFARDMAWSETAGVGTTAGWLIAQTLLPNGTTGIHVPYETTPSAILGSMLINDSSYCPVAAMDGTQGDGCVTFNVTGQGATWPTSLFLQVIADGFNGIVSCGWYSHNGANLTGWDSPDNGTGADSSCLLPDGQTTTATSAWTTYLAGLAPTYWNNYEELLPIDYPAPSPAVQWNLVGSGPYYAQVDPTGSPAGYSLAANPAYEQPSGCSGLGALATYPGSYCWPAASAYASTVQVDWYSGSAGPDSAVRNGTADFANLFPSDPALLRNLSNAGKYEYVDAPSLSLGALAFNLNWSLASYNSAGLAGYGTPNVPSDFLSGEAVRMLLIQAYPYAAIDQTNGTLSGISVLSPTGGPIPLGSNDYPTNVSYGAGTPVGNASIVGSAAWWWAQGTNSSSPYYDAELAACTVATPCDFDLFESGELTPGVSGTQGDLAASVASLTGGAVQPFFITFPAGYPGGLCLSPCCTYDIPTCYGADQNPVTAWQVSWGPDNFDPQDSLIPLAYPDSTYTYSDAVAEQFQVSKYDNTAVCGNSVSDYSNLIYWAKQPALNDSCEGVAYNVVGGMFYNATHETDPTLRGIEDWAIQSVLNNLGLYVWTDETTSVTAFAPWIDPASVNTNPLIGGLGDQLWFQVRNVPSESSVTFTEKGLPSGSTFNVTASSGGSAGIFNSSNGTASTSFFEPNGPLTYAFAPPAGYAVTKVSGAKGTTTSSTTVTTSGKGLKLTATFVPVQTLKFTASGLGPGQSWGVSLTWGGAKNGPPNGVSADAAFTKSTTASSLSFSVAQGPWKYLVNVPTDYKVSPAKGSVSVSSSTPPKALKFALVTAKYTFREHGLARGLTWGVTVTGATNATTVCSASGTSAAFSCSLESGSYDFTTATVAGYSAAPATGSLVVTAPKGATQKITYTAS